MRPRSCRPRRRLLPALLLALPAAASSAGAGEWGHRYVSMALQGDLSAAAGLFAAADPDSLDDRDRELAAAFHRRFTQGEEDAPLPGRPFADDVVRAYRSYWRAALLGREDLAAAELLLHAALRRALARRGAGPGADDGETMDRTSDALLAEGFHSLGGRTRPFLELMLWARQDTTRYRVELTDETRDVDVVFLRDFVVRGWADWATFGRASTGGWAGDEELFCLGDDYDVDSEHFRVSYLQHETRHFADYARFPALEQIDLEYRAKLTELVYADATYAGLLAGFARNAALNRAAPHSFANDAVVRAMSRAVLGREFEGEEAAWSAVDPADVHAAARTLLEENTRELEAAGAETVRGVVGA